MVAVPSAGRLPSALASRLPRWLTADLGRTIDLAVVVLVVAYTVVLMPGLTRWPPLINDEGREANLFWVASGADPAAERMNAYRGFSTWGNGGLQGATAAVIFRLGGRGRLPGPADLAALGRPAAAGGVLARSAVLGPRGRAGGGGDAGRLQPVPGRHPHAPAGRPGRDDRPRRAAARRAQRSIPADVDRCSGRSWAACCSASSWTPTRTARRSSRWSGWSTRSGSAGERSCADA